MGRLLSSLTFIIILLSGAVNELPEIYICLTPEALTSKTRTSMWVVVESLSSDDEITNITKQTTWNCSVTYLLLVKRHQVAFGTRWPTQPPDLGRYS